MGRLIRRRLEAGGMASKYSRMRERLDEIDGGAAFDLDLLDVRMPSGGLHGLALARMIKRRFRTARIIFVTGHPDLVSATDSKLGPVFAKPIDFIKLLNAG